MSLEPRQSFTKMGEQSVVYPSVDSTQVIMNTRLYTIQETTVRWVITYPFRPKFYDNNNKLTHQKQRETFTKSYAIMNNLISPLLPCII